jgi:hypothetical protein
MRPHAPYHPCQSRGTGTVPVELRNVASPRIAAGWLHQLLQGRIFSGTRSTSSRTVSTPRHSWSGCRHKGTWQQAIIRSVWFEVTSFRPHQQTPTNHSSPAGWCCQLCKEVMHACTSGCMQQWFLLTVSAYLSPQPSCVVSIAVRQRPNSETVLQA